MSRLIEFRNRIYLHRRLEWLSPSQKQTYDRLRQLLSFQDTVNLYGARGAGKTFLTWVLSQEVSTSFYSNLDKLEREATDRTTLAVVDPHPSLRSIVRGTLSNLHGLGYSRILLVSEEPVADQIPLCQLALAPTDFTKISQNWSDISIPMAQFPKPLEGMNLHEVLREIALSSLFTK
jgi:hypothetical protein